MDSKNMQLIAEGNGSKIYRYESKNGALALKFVPAEFKKQARHLANEAKVSSFFDHDYVLKCLKYQEKLSFHGKKQNSQLRDVGNVLVMQYATEGSLLNFLKKHQPSYQLKKSLLKKISQGLKHIHLKGYSHRDLKLENILIFKQKNNFYPKISDFGFASLCFIEGQQKLFNQFKGTQKGYMAPEIFNILKDKEASYDAMKTDIFSLGVIMFALVLGRLPFQFAIPSNKLFKLLMNNQIEQFWQQHRQPLQKFEQETGENEVAFFKDLFIRMVAFEASQRPRISEVCQHTWLISN